MLLLVKCYDNKMFKTLVDPTNIPWVGNGVGEKKMNTIETETDSDICHI